MNKHLQAYARHFIKERLTRCSPRQQDIFKRMYSHLNLDLPVDQVVDAMSADKLNWAMEQVEKTYQENVAAGSVKPLTSPNPDEGPLDAHPAPEEPTLAGHTWRCRDCYGPQGEEHSENCGVARGPITRDHCGDSPIPDRAD